MSRDMPWTRFSGRLVLGRSYSDPQEGLSGFVLLADREVSVRATVAGTTTTTTVHSKKNLMISIFASVSGFCSFYLESQCKRILDRIHLLLSSQHSSRASPKRTCLPECPENSSLLSIQQLQNKSTDFYFVSRKLGL